MLVKTHVGITTSEPHTDQRPTELLETQSVGSKKVPLHFWFSEVLQTNGGEEPWNASVIRETHTNIRQTESRFVKEDLSPNWTCQLYHLEQKCFSIHSPPKDKSRLHHFGTKMLPGMFIGYARRTGGGWTGNLIIADLHDIARPILTSKDPRQKLKDAFVFHCADGSSKQEGHAQRQTSRHRVESVDVGGVPSTLGEARVNLLQCARGDSLQEEGVVADFSEGDRGAMEAREYFSSMCGGIYLSPIRDAPRTLLCAERVIIFTLLKYIDVVRQTFFQLDKLEESIVEDVWSMDAHRRFSKNWNGSTCFRILNKRPPNGYS